MNLSRRGFLAGLIAAPAIVKIDSLMPIKQIIPVNPCKEILIPTYNSIDMWGDSFTAGTGLRAPSLFLHPAQFENIASLGIRLGSVQIIKQLPSPLKKGKLFKW